MIVQKEILAEVLQLKEQLGFSVLFITHDLSLLLEIADQVMVMYAGQMVEAAPTADGCTTGRRPPVHPRTAGVVPRGCADHASQLDSGFRALRRTRVTVPPKALARFMPRCGFAQDGLPARSTCNCCLEVPTLAELRTT